MNFVNGEFIASNLRFEALIPALQKAFCSDVVVPMRHHHDFENPKEGLDSTLLLMPAWQPSEHLGVKVVTVSPENGQYNLPSIQGLYILMDAQKGMPLSIMDAKALTVKRTAAASALASQFLSNKDASSLLMVGTGALAPNLIEAHAAVRPIENVFVWGRNIEKAKLVLQQVAHLGLHVEVVSDIESVASEVDILSCATLSPTPLIKGAWLRNGQHIDLVGAYKPDMREADDNLISKVRLYVDNFEGAIKETGDIVLPLNSKIISKRDIQGDLFELCREQKEGRGSEEEITCFKSVGHALEDLVAAGLVYEKLQEQSV